MTEKLVKFVDKKMAAAMMVEHHYLHRAPMQQFSIGLFVAEGGVERCVGACTFGTPASRHLQMSACQQRPDIVMELNRLWVDDAMPPNTESWFVSRALKLLPARIIVSYADTAAGHMGYIYRALNFHYAGWTDMERKTPRFDYVVPGKHSRDAFRDGVAQYTERVRRRPKVKYWTVTGDARERRAMERLASWPKLSWKTQPPPTA